MSAFRAARGSRRAGRFDPRFPIPRCSSSRLIPTMKRSSARSWPAPRGSSSSRSAAAISSVPCGRLRAANRSSIRPSPRACSRGSAARGAPANDGIADLTAQERKILDLVAEGMTNRQIAEKVFLAEKTVKNYVSNILLKLGLSRRAEAAAFMARRNRRTATAASGRRRRERSQGGQHGADESA